jgi:epoxyqueuosine reductase QueG
MSNTFQATLTAEQIKAKARALGADLAGIADGKLMDENPPTKAQYSRPSSISEHDAGRVIVLARRLNCGSGRLPRWNDGHKFYNDELTRSMLEETAFELCLWLENQGYPALMLPPDYLALGEGESHAAVPSASALSASHAAVEAGLGTLGLNQQLITPEYGPRVMISLVLCSVPVAADTRMLKALCLGSGCGRCLQACPADAIGHWSRDWENCNRFRSPYGFEQLSEYLEKIIDEKDMERQKELLFSEQSLNLWQATLRGSGVISGCRRCQDVCPVGVDYEAMLKDAVDTIAETNSEKEQRLADMRAKEASDEFPAVFRSQSRWIGSVLEECAEQSDN